VVSTIRIKRFYYAELPDALVGQALECREEFGVIRVFWHQHAEEWRVETARKAKDLPGHRRCTDPELETLRHLLAVRYWDLRFGKKETAV
jgi:hypothetical protein